MFPSLSASRVGMFLKEQYGVSIHTSVQPHTLPTQGRGGKSSPYSIVSIQDPTLSSLPHLPSPESVGNQTPDAPPPHTRTPTAFLGREGGAALPDSRC